jgi:hypothetical protein
VVRRKWRAFNVLSRSACSVVFGEGVKGFNHRGHRGSQGDRQLMNVDLFDALH